ncbi:GntP family permease [Rathayibacter toxicus]|uniref:GntP family permease n=1 Tax=Rathayibacter toxicus TaxID=145458 RepID=A0A0C5BD96_9MICO|nr:SLC13 family permease [Rathayibacter toxicus]AJM76949.1 hypothetical protein TI83_01125 [Rathayibacter toxicus]ALS57268.1 hypothetical protein APU90_05355 [Rathayibacter toxicus]KKM44373.1 hypothetical protein VT73_10015 [Rathayibacter toxicus]PPG24858.1 hypothetical protein C5D15_00940 [Rathayibacter toxicus]PPG48313.1 hypothetical protein C5D16_00955 [Rathayibacter toxicus]
MTFPIAVLSLVLSTAGLLLLIVRLRIHPYIAMTAVAIVLGLVFGLPLIDKERGVLTVIENAVGPSFAHIVPLIGLGCIIGEIISRSGGSELLGRILLTRLGPHRGVLAVVVAGLLVGSTIFFDIAVILLAPLAISLARQAGRNTAVFALPMAIAVLAVHAVLPPHPGAVAVASALGADYGLLSVLGLVTMLPGAALGCWWVSQRLHRINARGGLHTLEDVPPVERITAHPATAVVSSPTSGEGGFTTAVPLAEGDIVTGLLPKLLSVLTLPIALIFLATVTSLVAPQGTPFADGVHFVGTPVLALLITTVVAFFVLLPPSVRSRGGLTELGRVGLRPVGEIVLSTGGGVAFGGVIAASGIGGELVARMQEMHLPLVVFGFVLAASLRATLGTTTAAVTTVATLLATTIDVTAVDPVHVALLAVGVSAGGVCLSHVNDAGFWVLSRYFRISERTMLSTWTVGVTIMGVISAALTTVLWYLLPRSGLS